MPKCVHTSVYTCVNFRVQKDFLSVKTPITWKNICMLYQGREAFLCSNAPVACPHTCMYACPRIHPNISSITWMNPTHYFGENTCSAKKSSTPVFATHPQWRLSLCAPWFHQQAACSMQYALDTGKSRMMVYVHASLCLQGPSQLHCQCQQAVLLPDHH